MDAAEVHRETWLNLMAQKLAPRFAELGHPLPAFRASIGFPSSGKDSKANAECWNSKASADGHFEILIRPDYDDAVMVTALLAHELTHAAVGFDCGHKGNFAKVMKANGFKPPMTSTVPTDAFRAWVAPFIEELGPFPHARLTWRGAALDPFGAGFGEGAGGDQAPKLVARPGSSAPKKQTTRLKKANCSHCGYTVRVTQRWLEVGPPHCPQHGAMDCDVDLPDDGADE